MGGKKTSKGRISTNLNEAQKFAREQKRKRPTAEREIDKSLNKRWGNRLIGKKEGKLKNDKRRKSISEQRRIGRDVEGVQKTCLRGSASPKEKGNLGKRKE